MNTEQYRVVQVVEPPLRLNAGGLRLLQDEADAVSRKRKNELRRMRAAIWRLKNEQQKS